MLIIVGIVLLFWATYIIRNYDGYLEIYKKARHEALPQLISGLIFLIVAFFLPYSKKIII